MRITRLAIENFKAFSHLEKDGEFFSENKYLLVGKNGSGKTSVLEALRFCLAQGRDGVAQNAHLYHLVRDKDKPAVLELSIELDEAEVELCRDYLRSLGSEGGPQWNHEEKDTYDLVVDKHIISRVIISAPTIGGGQMRNGSVTRNQAYVSGRLLAPNDDGTIPNSKFHIITKLFQDGTNSHHPLVYLPPYRSVNFQDTMLFQNYGATVNQQMIPGINATINDPVASVNLALPEFGKSFAQYSYNAELYSGVLSEFYDIAKSNTDIRDNIRKRIEQEMVHVNEMIKPKQVEDIEMDLSSNALTYKIQGPDGSYTISGLSAGEEQLVIFGMSLPKVMSAGNDTIKPIIIVDEPELHLHPEYCKRLGQFFSKHLPTDSNQQLFIASHSVEIVQQLSDSAFQVSLKDITKLNDVKDRADMFNSMGSNFSVADLVSKVVFVEGSDSTRVIADSKFYQHLIQDPHARNVRFVGVGNKSNVIRVNMRSTEWRGFIQSQINSNDTSDVFAIVDGDVLGWVENSITVGQKVLVLPCYSVENLLLQPNILLKAFTQFDSQGINQAFESVREKAILATIDNLEKEFMIRSRRSFETDLSQAQEDIMQGFTDHVEGLLEAKAKLAEKYRGLLSNKSDWYLHVYGRGLGKELAETLSIDGGKPLYDELIKHTTLEDMPQEMRDWFTQHIL
jgi:predicted ATP-binding protein involved in virulence